MSVYMCMQQNSGMLFCDEQLGHFFPVTFQTQISRPIQGAFRCGLRRGRGCEASGKRAATLAKPLRCAARALRILLASTMVPQALTMLAEKCNILLRDSIQGREASPSLA